MVVVGVTLLDFGHPGFVWRSRPTGCFRSGGYRSNAGCPSMAGFGAVGNLGRILLIVSGPDRPYRCDSDDPFGCPVQRQPGCSGNPKPRSPTGNCAATASARYGAQPSCPAAPGRCPGGRNGSRSGLGAAASDLERYPGDPGREINISYFYQSDDLHRALGSVWCLSQSSGRTDHH